MSPKAVFYILTDSTLKGRDLYACRVIEKAYSSGKTIYVNVDTLEEAQNFDTQLWTFRDISFVPHEIYSLDSHSYAPVLIGYDNNILNEKRDILINISSEIPLFYKQFGHIIEVIPNDDNFKSAARKRYQTYQCSAYQMESFNI